MRSGDELELKVNKNHDTEANCGEGREISNQVIHNNT